MSLHIPKPLFNTALIVIVVVVVFVIVVINNVIYVHDIFDVLT